jgi:hypothetical protein
VSKFLGPTAPSAGKQMATVFWDTEDILMVEWLPLFDKMKDLVCGSQFPNDDDLQSSVHSLYYPKSLFAASIRKLPQRWQKYTDLSGEYVECAEV